MDTSIASLNRSTFEDRQKNVSYLRSLYFLVTLSLLIALGWSLWCIDSETLGNWVVKWWWVALIAAIICVILILATYFVPALSKPGVNIAIYAIFTICFAYVWGYLCALDYIRNYYLYVLILLLAIAFAFACYAW